MRVYLKEKEAKIVSLDGQSTKHVIWGDWLDVVEQSPPSSKYVVNWKVWDPGTQSVSTRPYLIDKQACQTDALLEMIFVDVGQGDGCIVNVPDGPTQRTIIVDAGQFSNMHNFLKWRFRYLDSNAALHAAVITHPDQDHYRGFVPIIKDRRVSFDHIYHNGLVERKTAAEADVLGPRSGGFCTELFESKAALASFLSDPAVRGVKAYPTLLWAALSDPNRFPDIRMASAAHGDQRGGKTYLPGFAPNGAAPTIELLGPVPEQGPNGALALRTFGKKPHDGKFATDKTKNGHSIILRLDYGGFSAIFGGDLNRPAEDYLLRHYGNISDAAPLSTAVAGAGPRFSADLLKCCHHGSADVTDEFLEAVDAFAFVVSSGDQEGHVHPRPDVLGLLGKKGEGDRPLILCTEILRSTPSSLTMSDTEKREFDGLLAAFGAATTDSQRADARSSALAFINRRTRRLVTQYGAITVRTDGSRLLIAFRKEVVKKDSSPWQLFEYEKKPGGWTLKEESGGH